jgi:hypothetical protein
MLSFSKVDPDSQEASKGSSNRKAIQVQGMRFRVQIDQQLEATSANSFERKAILMSSLFLSDWESGKSAKAHPDSQKASGTFRLLL